MKHTASSRRSHRLVVVVPRSLNYGTEWMLKHSQTEFTLPMVHEELEFVSQIPHEQQLLKIFELAHVEYGRIDYDQER